ncbi:glycosyltransferase family 39 protein [Tautonia sociabilis]|nr:glycosyltransferase family 39 protein [Tautonia sociabilis]
MTPDPDDDAPCLAPAEPDPARLARWALGFLALGVVLRLVRFLLRYPLWHDEAFIAVNFIDRGFRELALPLDYLQVCPILFLWVERAIVGLLGFNEWSLRLFPTLCAIGGLVLFDRLARRTLPGWGYPIAVGILAVSYSPIRHGNEVKSYATDLLAATALLWLASRWLAEPSRSRWPWALAAVAPAALAGSLTAVFVVGAIGLVTAPVAWRSGRARVWAAFAAFGATSAATFLALFRFHLSTARSEWLRTEYLLPYWADSFPPLADGPLAVSWWLVRIHAGNLLSYPIGGDHGASAASLALVVVGLIALLRTRRWGLAALLVLPFALNLAAAALGRYPYGGEARIAQHLAPSACLLAGLGASRLIERCRSAARAERLRRLAIAGLGLIGLGLLVQQIVWPYHMISAARDREFARWFWPEQARAAKVLCLKADLGLDFEPRQWNTGISASYLCNRAIYDPGFPPAPDPDPDSDSAPDGRARPIRFVLFHVDSYPTPIDSPGFRSWFDAMSARHRFRRIDSYVVNADRGETGWKVGRYWVVEFDPEAREEAAPPPELASRPPASRR